MIDGFCSTHGPFSDRKRCALCFPETDPKITFHMTQEEVYGILDELDDLLARLSAFGARYPHITLLHSMLLKLKEAPFNIKIREELPNDDSQGGDTQGSPT